MTKYFFAKRTKWYLSLLHRFKDGICIFWVGHIPTLCLYDPNLIQIVLSNNVHIEKPDEVLLLREWLGNGLLTSTGKQWHRDRKLLTPTFHFSILKQFAVIMSDKAKNLIKHIEKILEENPGKAINIQPSIDKAAINIILETAMGVNAYDIKSLFDYKMAGYRYNRLYTHRVNSWYYRLLKPIHNLLPITKQIRENVTCLHNVTDEVIRKKKLIRKTEGELIDYDIQNKPRNKAFLDLLLDLKNNDATLLNDEDIRAHVDTFMAAGNDTTRISICWALFCIGNYLNYQEKIHEELEEVFKDSQKPATVQEISQLKYLDRVIKESRRLYPAIPAIKRTLSEDTKLGDYIIPANTRVIISMLLVHRNPAIWPNPLKFDPDRFLPENIKHTNPYAYIPFSAGPRNCIGQKFAMLEEKIILTAILRQWRVTCTETPADKIALENIILEPYQGVSLHLVPKKRNKEASGK
ncbi:cytochrome P450 4C1-like [Pseudomyrmex gracilis]|uniref:cytochrome P450 4C1-like n=1 Tax=Pseudomyrmex gracilis TaxID=219809 RepID=UPI000995917B|nr:cytochrome P450 4C1-like [Pseudomyrmex gracilis]